MQPFFYMDLEYIRSMFLYNITIIAESDSASDVGNRIRDFKDQRGSDEGEYSVKFLKLLESPHEGVTYCLQLQVENQNQILRFQQLHLQGLQTALEQQYPGKVLYFESVMEYLS